MALALQASVPAPFLLKCLAHSDHQSALLLHLQGQVLVLAEVEAPVEAVAVAVEAAGNNMTNKSTLAIIINLQSFIYS